MDWENHGERALFQNAEQRDMNERLRAIEEELNKLHNPEEIEVYTVVLINQIFRVHFLISSPKPKAQNEQKWSISIYCQSNRPPSTFSNDSSELTGPFFHQIQCCTSLGWEIKYW